MKFVIIAISILIINSFMGCNRSENLLFISINTKSNSKAIGTKVTVENWDKNAKLVSISITNNGDKTEVIKDIRIRLKNTPVFNEDSKFLYGSYEMSSKTPVQLRSFNDEQLFTESIFVAKNADNNFGVVSFNSKWNFCYENKWKYNVS